MILKNNGNSGILRGRMKYSYTLLLCSLLHLWGRTGKVTDWAKYKSWVFKQQFTKHRFEDLGLEEIRSAYLDARKRVFNMDDTLPILGEAEDQANKALQIQKMVDKDEIAKAQKVIEEIKADGVEDGGLDLIV